MYAGFYIHGLIVDLISGSNRRTFKSRVQKQVIDAERGTGGGGRGDGHDRGSEQDSRNSKGGPRRRR